MKYETGTADANAWVLVRDVVIALFVMSHSAALRFAIIGRDMITMYWKAGVLFSHYTL